MKELGKFIWIMMGAIVGIGYIVEEAKMLGWKWSIIIGIIIFGLISFAIWYNVTYDDVKSYTRQWKDFTGMRDTLRKIPSAPENEEANKEYIESEYEDERKWWLINMENDISNYVGNGKTKKAKLIIQKVKGLTDEERKAFADKYGIDIEL